MVATKHRRYGHGHDWIIPRLPLLDIAAAFSTGQGGDGYDWIPLPRSNQLFGEKESRNIMQSRAPLMIEHRLIERMLTIVEHALKLAEQTGSIDPIFVDLAVDFITTYADRTHHGKEEDILFRTLESKALSKADRQVMNELIEEHKFGRKTTKALVGANSLYRNGEKSALALITTQLRTLAEFYPKHIEKEDKVFFPASRTYLSYEEDQGVLAEFMEFDRKMIHEKYETIVKNMETK